MQFQLYFRDYLATFQMLTHLRLVVIVVDAWTVTVLFPTPGVRVMLYPIFWIRIYRSGTVPASSQKRNNETVQVACNTFREREIGPRGHVAAKNQWCHLRLSL